MGLLGLQAFGQIVAPFSVRYQTNTKGGIRYASNVSLICPSSGTCTTAKNELPPNGTYSNGDFQMTYVDIDNDPTTFMSSSDSIALPNCSEILWVGLYWSARIAGNTANYNNRSQVRFKLNNGSYVGLTADQTLDVPTIGGQSWTHPSYYCFKDITSLIPANSINARFTVANLVTQGGSNFWGGWTVIVVYRNALQSMRNLTVFEGFANVAPGNSLNIPITGFTTPPSGPVTFELGVISMDGDRPYTGDQLQFNGVTVSDGLHNANNFFNSTISNNGVLTPYRNPNLNNTLGYDASTFNPNNTALNYIGNNANSANILVSTSNEFVLPRVITSAIDIYEPDLRATVYVQDLNGGQVVPGDILEYTIVGKNIGSDVSNNTYITDTLDPRTVYVPGSITYVNAPFLGPKTDAIGDDQAEYVAAGHYIKARVKSGANALIGGSMNNSPNGSDSAVVRFRVQVLNDCLLLACDSTITNKAYIFGTGNISNNPFTNNGLSDIYNANGCPTNITNQLTIHSNCQPPTVAHNNPLCLGDSLYFIIPYSATANYFWAGPNGFSSTTQSPTIYPVTASNAGVYQLNITFTGSTCSFFNLLDTVVVHPNPTISLLNLNNITCFNAANGAITVQASSTPIYNYLWNTGATTAGLNNLGPGLYTVTVSDGYGCQNTASYQITQPTLLVASAAVTSNYNGQQISCFNASDGTASVTPSGGTAPYTYLWSNGQTTANATGLSIGSYSVVVTDAHGCQTSASVNLTQPTPIVLATSATSVTCYGGSNGSIHLTATGGTFPYTFAWSNGTNSQNAVNLSAGVYTVTVSDINGCSQVTNAT
ncbi:MAG: DUF11 domain-containing protein, partial [Flavobacteriia bacterium]|nr:DUF11 domain-containing protein [Flavobacteriia bacterium]